MKSAVLCVVLFLIVGCGSTQKVDNNSAYSASSNLQSSATIQSAEIERLVAVWPRVKSLLLGAHSYIPDGLEPASKSEVQSLVSSIDNGIAASEWSGVWDSWLEGDISSTTVFMSINWKYGGNRGEGTEPYREYERWHVREFEKTAVLLSNDKGEIKTTKSWYGTLKKTMKPEIPN